MAITNGLCVLVKIREFGVHGRFEWHSDLAVAERAEAIGSG
jgi:hypothetical protein